MRRMLVRILVLGVTFLVVAHYIPGVELSGSALSAFFAAFVFAVLNLLVTPVVWILKLIAFPLNFITLGVMSLIISFAFNVLIFWVMSTMEWGIRVNETTGLLLGPLVFVIVAAILNFLVVPPKEEEE